MKDENRPARTGEEEAFLERWSRRKAEARAGRAEPEATGVAERPDADPPATAADALPPLPDLDSLGEGSDYSVFLTPGVDEALRRQALRKLFHSPKFNVCDGLDDYCGDFTKYDELGDIVTADMRHQLERAAQRLEQMAESAQEGRAEANESPQQQPEPAREEDPDDDRIAPA